MSLHKNITEEVIEITTTDGSTVTAWEENLAGELASVQVELFGEEQVQSGTPGVKYEWQTATLYDNTIMQSSYIVAAPAGLPGGASFGVTATPTSKITITGAGVGVTIKWRMIIRVLKFNELV